MPGALDGCAIGERVAERHTQLDDIRAALCGSQRERDTLRSRRKAAHEIRHECAVPLALRPRESLANFQGRSGVVCCRWHSVLQIWSEAVKNLYSIGTRATARVPTHPLHHPRPYYERAAAPLRSHCKGGS